MADRPANRTNELGAPLQRLFWTRRAALTARILTVNIVALAFLGASLFYLDSYRKQLLVERFKLARSEAQITAEGECFDEEGLLRLLRLARIGCDEIFSVQDRATGR